MPAILDASGEVISWVDQDTEGRWRFGQWQDCDPVLEHNKRLQTMNDGYSPSRGLKRIASIPVSLIQQWLMEDGIDPVAYWGWRRPEQNAYLRKRHQSNEYRHLRTS